MRFRKSTEERLTQNFCKTNYSRDIHSPDKVRKRFGFGLLEPRAARSAGASCFVSSTGVPQTLQNSQIGFLSCWVSKHGASIVL